jgi:flavin-dependent thymidylate synthase
VDTDVLEELKKHSSSRSDITPETLSASYARISRDPRPINELRAVARSEVEKARKSNRSIIFKMGHHSVAEHAVFNFDIIGVSRLALEHLEKFRLASYTEKSQRYITLGDDFYVPDEIKRSRFIDKYVAVIKKQNAAYHSFFAKLKKYVFKQYADLAKDPKNHNLLEGWAKEDARYITALATLGQLGMTINARNLEYLFRRFASQELSEVKAIGAEMYRLVEKIAPSIILFVAANDFDRKTYPALGKFVAEKLKFKSAATKQAEVTLVQSPADGDVRILAALLHAVSRQPYTACLKKAKSLSAVQQRQVFKKTFEHLQFYDSVLREFEFAEFTFELVVSAAAFGQLKRHRMATLTTQPYDPALKVLVPDSIKAIGEEKNFMRLIAETENLYEKLVKVNREAAPYVLTNAHRRRVLLKVNLREMYHLSRLREDAHAQWDIRNLSAKMSDLIKEKMPQAAALLCGKDQYGERFRALFGCWPEVRP